MASSTPEPAMGPFKILRQRSKCHLSQSSDRSMAGYADTRMVSPPNSSSCGTETLRIGNAAEQRLPRSCWRRVGDQQLEQVLTLQPACRGPVGDPLEQHAFVCDMLVDDRDAFLVDGDDEGVAELAKGIIVA